MFSFWFARSVWDKGGNDVEDDAEDDGLDGVVAHAAVSLYFFENGHAFHMGSVGEHIHGTGMGANIACQMH